jgi:hypothetical protein
MDDMSDDDQVVVVPIDSAERMAAAILDAAKIGREIVADIQAEAEQQQPAREREPRLALPAPAHPTARPTVVKRVGVA